MTMSSMSSCSSNVRMTTTTMTMKMAATPMTKKPRMWLLRQWLQMMKTIEVYFIVLLLLILIAALLWTTTQHIDMMGGNGNILNDEVVVTAPIEQDVNSTSQAAENARVAQVFEIDFNTVEGKKEDADQRRLLSRSKRLVAFPEGASFSCAVCMTTGVIGNPNFQWLSLGLNWGIAYDLPNVTWVKAFANGFGKPNSQSYTTADLSTAAIPSDEPDATPMPFKAQAIPTIKRRYRRDLYGKLETVIDSMGYNGRDCILRALCESRQYFQRNKLGMIGEMLRVIFSLPKQRIYTRELHEGDDIKHYDHAYRKARSIDCAAQYDCSFSLLELALGRYSTAPPGYYEQHN